MHSFWPRTRLGWWAFIHFTVFLMLYLINGVMLKATIYSQWWLSDILPYYGLALGYTVINAALAGIVAWLYVRDDAWSVRFATAPIWVVVCIRVFIAVITALHL